MFLGHMAVAFAAKKAAPQVKLGTFLFASQFVDILFPILYLIGLEHFRPDPGNTTFTPYDFYDYPFSHSLFMGIGWALLLGGLYFLRHHEKRGAIIIGVCVVTHWLLDFVSHRPDMPIAPGIQLFVGLGLWNSIVGTAIVEYSLFAMGIWLYILTTKATDRIGIVALWSFVGLLAFLYLGNVFSRTPVEPKYMVVGSLVQLIVFPWAYWIDRHRKVTSVNRISSNTTTIN
jgi:hypothetical protein